MILIKNGKIIDPLSKLQNYMDILIQGEKIVKIEEHIEEKDEFTVINAEDCIVAPGLIDIHVHFRDPGFTYKEDIYSGAESAAKGGYTTVICMANTDPIVDNIETLEYILNKGKKAKIEVLQVATITEGLKGEKLTPMEELKKAGAVGFSDDGKPIMNAKVVMEAMTKAKALNMPLSFHEEDSSLIKENGVNMGEVAKHFNLSGSPREAEEVLVARDAVLAISTGAKTNIQHISSKLSVEIIKWAKNMGANIVGEVTPHHFSLTEKSLLEHKGNAKMNPPLREEEDRIALIQGLKDGVLEIIATDHAPHSNEEKSKELNSVPSGIVGLETALALGITNLVRTGHLSYIELLEKMTINPAKFYGLDRGYIKEGHRADIVIFNPEEKWKVEEFLSKSSNSPFLGKEFYGKIKNTIYKGQVVYSSNKQ